MIKRKYYKRMKELRVAPVGTVVVNLPESEETEVKKDIEWLKKEIKVFQNGENMFTAEFNAGVQDALEYVQELIEQLDKPEDLTNEWLDEHSNGPSRSQYVWVDDLKDLFVPK